MVANDPFCWEHSNDMFAVPSIVDGMLDIFAINIIRATWATVGAVGCGGFDELRYCSQIE